MKQFKTRETKIQLLKSIASGKTLLQAILEPVYGVIYLCNGKVYAREDKEGYKALEKEIDFETYKRLHVGTYSHQVQFVDFNQGIVNNNKKQ